MTFKKKDFIEIEFTARVKDGEIFDSNVKEDLEKVNLTSPVKAKPFVFCLGEGMFLKGVDDFLIGKPSKPSRYELELTPEKAFGNRDPRLIQIMPMRIFKEQKLNPVPGVMFNFDGKLAKILSVSGGRIIVDFNNPVSGKTVLYQIKVLRKVNDINEKAEAFINFLFKRDFDFEIKNKKIIIKADKSFTKFIEIFKEKFKEVLGLDLEVKELVEEAKKEEDKKDKITSLKSQ